MKQIFILSSDLPTLCIYIYIYNNIHQWLRECKTLLKKNEKAKKFGDKLAIGLKQPRKLKRKVTGVKRSEGTNPHEKPGCSKCGKCKVSCPILNEGSTFKNTNRKNVYKIKQQLTCNSEFVVYLGTCAKCKGQYVGKTSRKFKHCRVSCPILQEGGTFRSTNTQKVYRIGQHLTCNSDFVVYLGTCVKCKGQYVGKTTRKFKLRHSGHKQEIKREYGGLGHHYGGDNGCGYQNIAIQIIDQVESGNHQALAECELHWQHQLRCFVENGGNAHSYRKEL